MRIYAILENVRIAYIFFHFFAYGQWADAVSNAKAPLLQRKIELWNWPPPNSTL